MPEIPEVEAFRKIAKKNALNKTVKDVKVKEAALLEDITKKSFAKQLKGHKFTKTARHGKYLFMRINGKWLVVHFGMTGEFVFQDAEKDEPEYTKVRLDFPKDRLAYINKRKLGNLRIVKSKKDFLDEKQVGPDSKRISFKTFYKIMQEKKGTVKGAFMDQHTIAGIGNEYSDEILFNSHIHPESKSENLKKSDWKKLYNQMKRILKKAIEKRTKNEKLPKTWILRHREEQENCPRCDGKVKNKQIAGRSSYFCPKCQVKIK
jgi:formamidopyrimidine-DNA glycosylase